MAIATNFWASTTNHVFFSSNNNIPQWQYWTKSIPATSSRLNAFTQHMSWPQSNLNGDQLAPLGNSFDNIWAPLRTIWRPLWVNFETPLRQTRKYGTTSTQLCNHFATILKPHSKHSVAAFRQFLDNFDKTLRQLSDNFGTTWKENTGIAKIKSPSAPVPQPWHRCGIDYKSV